MKVYFLVVQSLFAHVSAGQTYLHMVLTKPISSKSGTHPQPAFWLAVGMHLVLKCNILTIFGYNSQIQWDSCSAAIHYKLIVA